MRTTLRGLAIGTLALLPACAGADREVPAAAAPQPPAAEEQLDARSLKLHDADGRLAMADVAGATQPPGAPAPRGAPGAATNDAVAVRSQVLIYTAQITMAVFEVNASLARVETIGRELGGFLAKRDDATITIRVPAAAFDAAVKRIETVGDMLHRNVAAEDVTEEFRDLEVRLRSARAVQARLTELLAKAAKVEDSLAIERELDRVSGEIERIEGRMKFLRDRAAFSTITVRFQPKASEQVGDASVRLPVPWLYDINLPRLLHL